MSDLYTSQVHLKRLLAGQATPAFTSAPDAVLKMLDPAFFPGMGALNEDPKTGNVQCPIRGCGQYHFQLGRHLSKTHPHIGSRGIRAALGIPLTTSLLSTVGRERYRSSLAKSRRSKQMPKYVFTAIDRANSARSQRLHTMHLPKGQKCPSARNHADSCPAQLQAKIIALREEIGRSPSIGDFRKKYGPSAERSLVIIFGTWNNAKATAGLSVSSPGCPTRVTIALLCEALRAWVDIHGDLPNITEIRTKTPSIPSQSTILRVFGVTSWPAAMRSAAEHLSIKSERYGFDFRKKGKT